MKSWNEKIHFLQTDDLETCSPPYTFKRQRSAHLHFASRSLLEHPLSSHRHRFKFPQMLWIKSPLLGTPVYIRPRQLSLQQPPEILCFSLKKSNLSAGKEVINSSKPSRRWHVLKLMLFGTCRLIILCNGPFVMHFICNTSVTLNWGHDTFAETVCLTQTLC